MAKKSKKESSKIQESTSITSTSTSISEEAPKDESKFFIKPFCKCITPYGVFEKDKFVAVSKEIMDHLAKHGIKFERAN